MDLDSYIHEAIFEEKEKYTFLYELFWQNFIEDGFVITDEPNTEIDCILKAISLQNIIGEFSYRMYDELNETSYEDVIEYLANLDIQEEKIIDYCKNNNELKYDDDELIIKNALDQTTQEVANKLLETYSSEELFDYIFTATYDFQQDFTFAFEDVDEFQAFVDANYEKLDQYKEEDPNVLEWIKNGMPVWYIDT